MTGRVFTTVNIFDIIYQIKLSFQDFEVENSGVSFSINTENE